jgi:mRNA-degrading endonuclease toxin of MazEF toxin-antitoxin module
MKHGEVWLVDFAPKVGQEIDKVRPAVIVNHDSMGALQLKIVVPITDAIRQFEIGMCSSIRQIIMELQRKALLLTVSSQIDF